MQRISRAAAALAAVFVLALAQQQQTQRLGSFAIRSGKLPLIAGSRLQLETTGAPQQLSYTVLGAGTVEGDTYEAPLVDAPAFATVIAAGQGALAAQRFALVPPPQSSRPLIAVASYDDGIVLHDPQTFAILGTFALGGPPGDVTFSSDGTLYAPDTDGETLTEIARHPWTTHRISGVLTGNEVAVDARGGAIFVSDRDVNGLGALTRVAGTQTQRVITGETAEGLAIDAKRALVYTGNVNDASIAVVDAGTMRIVRKLRSAPRTFGIALDTNASRLYVVANISPDMRIGSGYVAAIDLRAPQGKIVARSAGLPFPVGIAADGARLFVTDESSSEVYVLNARTLKADHAGMPTCKTPWRPRIAHGRLYVPCTGSNQVDVIDLKTLRRVRGAPFKTGGYPLSVAVWP